MDGTATRWTCETIPGPESQRSCRLSEQEAKMGPINATLYSCQHLWELLANGEQSSRRPPSARNYSFIHEKKRNGRAHNQAFKTRSAGRLHVNASLKAATKLDRDSTADAFMQRRAIRGCHRGLKNGEKSSVIFRFPPFFLITSRGANYLPSYQRRLKSLFRRRIRETCG